MDPGTRRGRRSCEDGAEMEGGSHEPRAPEACKTYKRRQGPWEAHPHLAFGLLTPGDERRHVCHLSVQCV